MTQQKAIDDIFANYPIALVPHIGASESNIPTTIYSGNFLLRKKDTEICITGSINYNWFGGKPGIVFEGSGLKLSLVHFNGFDLYIDGHFCGEARISNETFQSKDDQTYYYGYVRSLTLGDSTRKCTKVCFSFINLCHLFGDLIRRNTNSIAHDRLTFSNGIYSIIVENREGLDVIDKKFKQRPESYYLSHYCQITKQGDMISIEEANDVLRAFSIYISFVYGKRYEPFFIYGYKNEEKVCEYHTANHLPSPSSVCSWSPHFEYEDIESLWGNFYNLWQQNDDEKDVLLTAIHWYIESNANNGLLEGAYIMAFAGLELMYNTLVGTKVKTAEDKINTLIQQLHTPATFNAKELSNMRNCLVHYGEKNRAAYSEIGDQEKYACITKLMYLLELSVLKYLNYQGRYVSRLERKQWRGNTEVVPYMATNL